MTQIRLDFTTSFLLPVVLAIAATAAAWFFYRHTVPPVAPILRRILIALRASALTVLVLLILQPVAHFQFSSTRQPVLAVLADNTRSMSITDRSGDRASTLRSILAGDPLRTLGRRVRLATYTFGTGLRPFSPGSGDTMTLDENGTDLSAALRLLGRQRARAPVDAVLLLTDGSYNLGEDPSAAAQELGIPVYAVGVGDSLEPKDIVINRIAANDIVYSGVSSPVDATVKSSGFDGETIEVTLAQGVRDLDRARVTLQPGTHEYPVHLMYTPEGEGRRKLTVRTSTLPGELSTANNQRTFWVDVVKNKLHLVVLAGAPGSDLSVVRQTLLEDKNFDVHAFAQRTPAGFYGGGPTASLLDSCDCLVLIGFPTSSTPPYVLDALRNRLTMRHLPVLFIGGPSVTYDRLQSMGVPLPYTVEGAAPAEQLVYAQPAESQRGNPLLAASPSSSSDPWNRLPPIYRTATAIHAKPEATVLALGRSEGGPGRDPLIMSRSLNHQKCIAVAGYGVWRWRLMAQGDPQTEQLLLNFLSNAVRWLTGPDENRFVRVTAGKSSYSEGERVDFIGQVYNQSAQPVDDAHLQLNVRHEGKARTAELMPVGDGRYEGSLEGLGEGDYAFEAAATLNGTSLGADSGRFSMGGVNLEFLDTRMHAGLLRRLATETGGRFLSPSEVDKLDSLLAGEPWLKAESVVQKSDVELWNWPYLLAAVILLLAGEWLIRKRTGMI